MRVPELFSKGASQAISILAGANKGEGKARFPSWIKEDARIKGTQSVSEWFQAVVGDGSGSVDRILEAAINDHLLMLGSVSWQNGNVSFCRLHAVVVLDGTLWDLCSDVAGTHPQTQYYRLDYDPEKPGSLFGEPLPHIHCWPEGAPRISLPGNADESLAVRFLEFIYLNHFHEDWTRWAKTEVKRRSREGFPIESIIEGYTSGSILARLEEFEPHLKELRIMLASAKRDYCRSSPFIPESIRMLNYSAKDSTS